ncbi:ABC transporter permease [Flagellimonas sp. 2504JD1-5]
MFKNHIKIAWRNLLKNKVYSFINIGGLAIGITACFMILQYVNFELSYDQFHANKDRIYRIQQDRYDNGKLSTQWAGGAYAAGNSFAQEIPEIESYVKVIPSENIIVEVDNNPLKINKVYFTQTSFFEVFSYPLINGNVENLLDEPNAVVVSESTAKQIYGSIDVIGQTLNVSGGTDYTITGIFKDMPTNTHLKANILVSYPTYLNIIGDDSPDTAWAWDGCLTYVLLSQGAIPSNVEAKFVPIVEAQVGEFLRRFNAGVTYSLQPLTDIHLKSNYMEEAEPNGNGGTVYLLLGVALFIIVIAWVNYINLATARAVSRAKEVGVRKSIGSLRKQLIAQFFFESALFNGIALVLAVLLMLITIPSFNQLSGQQMSYTLFSELYFWIGLTAIFLVGVFLSGSYPAFVLSSFKPVEVLKGTITSSNQGQVLRKALVVFQFAASLFLLIGSYVVYQQISFMRNQSLGVNIDQTLVIKPPIVSDSTFTKQKEAFKSSLLQYPFIDMAAVSSTVPGQDGGINAGGIRLVSEEESKQKQYRFMRVDHDFMNLYDLKLIAGRGFSREFGADKNTVVFNRKGITQLGFDNPDEALGKEIEFWGNQYTIVGVIENFHQLSLREAYDPLILCLVPDVYGYFSLKVQSEQVAQTMGLVQKEWDNFFPGNTFEHFFLDDHFNAQYVKDRQFGKVFSLFTILAILVACLGLFGLASFTTLQRTKEIGIRKVLGASVLNILKLLYMEFGLLLIISFVLAIPLAWFMANNWLETYAFSISIHWSFFALPFMVLLGIAFLTVSFQSLKASLANPVKSLRTE